MPPPGQPLRLMARIGQERWQTERVVDMGFNLAVAGGVLVILAGGFGLAWSLGLSPSPSTPRRCSTPRSREWKAA